MTDHKTVEHYVPVFRWELTALHQKQFGKAHPVYCFLKSLCKLTARPLRANTQVKRIADDMGIDSRTVERHLKRLRKFNYITTRQTQHGIAFEIVLHNDKYVGPASSDNAVGSENSTPTKLSDLNDKTDGPDTTKLSDLKNENENSTHSKDNELQPSPDKTVGTLRLKQDFIKIKPDVGLLIWFFQRTYFNLKKANLPDDGLQDLTEEILKYIPSRRLARCAWLVFLHGYADDEWLAGKPKSLKIFHGQVRNGKFIDEAHEFLERRIRDGVEMRQTTTSARPVDAAAIAEAHNPTAFAFWEKVKERIRPQILKESFETWFAPTYPWAMNGESITVGVPNQFIKNCLIENYRELIETEMQEVDSKYQQVDFCKHNWG